MQPAYVSALAALGGAALGGLASLAGSWITQREQIRAQRRSHEAGRREDLYKAFIEEAAAVYADAWAHDKPDVSRMVRLYALVGVMRIMSAPRILGVAEKLLSTIIATYSAPNRTLDDLSALVESEPVDVFREFSEVCRDELRGTGFFA